MMKVMVALMKKLKKMDDTVETIAESVDTLIEIESERIKRG
jgi:hypothetical protein